MNSTFHPIVVSYQSDSDAPTVMVPMKYSIAQEETEIIFPSGAHKTFKNWDVKDVRESFYRAEVLEIPAEEYLQSVSVSAESTEYGIKPSDVRRFISLLAKKPQYESLFEIGLSSEFADILSVLSRGASANA